MGFLDTFVNNALVLFTATHLLHMEQMQWLINAVGIQTQTLKKEVLDSAAVVSID